MRGMTRDRGGGGGGDEQLEFSAHRNFPRPTMEILRWWIFSGLGILSEVVLVMQLIRS